MGKSYIWPESVVLITVVQGEKKKRKKGRATNEKHTHTERDRGTDFQSRNLLYL